MNIRTLRENKGWSAEELAVKAGVSTQTVYRIEQGKPVSRRYVAKVCNTLGVAIDQVQGISIRD